MGVSGSFGALAELLRKVERASDAGLRTRLNQVLGREGRSLVDRGFRAGKEPDGATWAPLALRDGQPLRDTGRLQRSMTYSADAAGFRIGTNVQYAPTHQFGATIRPVNAKALRFKVRGGGWHMLKVARIPPRPFLPLERLPRAWATALEHAGRAFVDAELKP